MLHEAVEGEKCPPFRRSRQGGGGAAAGAAREWGKGQEESEAHDAPLDAPATAARPARPLDRPILSCPCTAGGHNMGHCNAGGWQSGDNKAFMHCQTHMLAGSGPILRV